MRDGTRRRWGAVLTAALAAQVSGCGTLFYPERKGQEHGKVDAKVAILDGIGLLFFIIPGVIAFIVDFDNGTIYLPGTHREHGRHDGDAETLLPTAESDPWIAVRVGPARLDRTAIRAVVGRNTGHWLDMNDPRLKVARVARESAAPGVSVDAIW